MLGVMSWPSLSAGGHDLTVKLFVVFFFFGYFGDLLFSDLGVSSKQSYGCW
jgi:hypothetical protein